MTDPTELVEQSMGRPRSFTDAEAFQAVLNTIKAHGHSNLTMNLIAAELGCTAPALMSRFGSKKGLLRAFIEWGNRLTEEHFQDAMAQHASPVEALKARFSSVQLAESHEFSHQFNQLNIFAFHVTAWTDPALRDSERERRAIFERNIVELLERSLMRGEIGDCDPASLGRVMLAAIVGTALQWETSPSPDTGCRIVTMIEELLRPYMVEQSARS